MNLHKYLAERYSCLISKMAFAYTATELLEHKAEFAAFNLKKIIPFNYMKHMDVLRANCENAETEEERLAYSFVLNMMHDLMRGDGSIMSISKRISRVFAKIIERDLNNGGITLNFDLFSLLFIPTKQLSFLSAEFRIYLLNTVVTLIYLYEFTKRPFSDTDVEILDILTGNNGEDIIVKLGKSIVKVRSVKE